MTEATAPTRESEAAEFFQIWSDSFSHGVSQIKGSTVPCTVRTDMLADLPPTGEGDFRAVITSSGALRGEMSVRLAGVTVLRLARIFMSMSEPDTPEAQPTADHREAVVELLRQVSGIVSTTAKARWGEVQLRVELAPAAPSWPSAETFWLLVGEQDATGMALEFGLSAALVAELRAEKTEATKKAEIAKTVTASSPTAALADSGQGTGALDLLMDVQLAMTLRFGARRLLLREVLDLSAGAVIELDRKVQEPVDLLLDGRLVARGEVVLIDGNYGLRVTDTSTLGNGG
jgi:flagellar motor switch protein FliN/FliY